MVDGPHLAVLREDVADERVPSQLRTASVGRAGLKGPLRAQVQVEEDSFLRVVAKAMASRTASSGVMSTFASPDTPRRPNRLRAPRDSQTIDELMMAPGSTVRRANSSGSANGQNSRITRRRLF